jgi:hypothetical protein
MAGLNHGFMLLNHEDLKDRKEKTLSGLCGLRGSNGSIQHPLYRLPDSCRGKLLKIGSISKRDFYGIRYQE